MLPSGKFFRKIIAISPDLVYTGRCIGHSSLRRKQVSSPPVQPHPAASRRGRQNCLPRLFFAVFLFCRYSYFQRCHCSVFSLSRLCYRSGTCAFGTAAGPAFALLRLLGSARYSPVSDSVIGMDPAFSRRCYHLGSCFFSVPIICRYFLFFGIDSSPVPGSFFSAGVPFLDLREGCFYPFWFLRCRFFGLHPPVLSSYCPIF